MGYKIPKSINFRSFFLFKTRTCGQISTKEKRKKMFNGSNCDRKLQLAGIRSTPLYPPGV